MSYSNPEQPKDGTGEPSMEEILASIRRILKDEAVKNPAPAPLDDDILILDSSMLAKPVDISSATSPPAAPLPATESPATPLQSTAAPLHFASEPTLINPIYTPPPAAPEPAVLLNQAPEPAIMPAPAPAPSPDDMPFKPAGLAPPPIAPIFGGRPAADFPVLQTPPLEPQPEFRPAPLPPEPRPAPQPEPLRDPPAYTAPPSITPNFTPSFTPNFTPEPRLVPEPPPPMPAPSPAIQAPPPPAAKQPPSETKMPENQNNFQPPASLVSDQVTAAAANSIGAMLRNLTAEKSVAVSRSGVTIEDMVRDEIRPLLKAWLDTNLAGLVERVVRSEIEKVMERTNE